MVVEIGNPTGYTGIRAGDTVPENQRDITTGTVQDSVAYEVVTLVEETKITA